MAHKIIAIQGLTGLKPGVTLNVGVINGGTRPNIIPDYAEAEIDLRVEKPEEEKLVIEELKKITSQMNDGGCRAKITGGLTRPPMPVTAETLKLFQIFQEAGAELGFQPGAAESGGGSDANFTAALGVPTIDGIGPIGGGHHSESEYLIIPSLFQRINLLANFLSMAGALKI